MKDWVRALAEKQLGAGGVPRLGTLSAPDLGEIFGAALGGVLRPIFGLGGVVLPAKFRSGGCRLTSWAGRLRNGADGLCLGGSLR